MSIDTGITLYKCRNCGEIFKGSSISSYDAVYTNFISLMARGETWQAHKGFGNAPDLQESHFCDDDTIGWGDIAGIKKVKGKSVEDQIKELKGQGK